MSPACLAAGYSEAMTATFEVPPHSAAPAEAVDAAVDGEVVFLTHNGEQVAAIVPPSIAIAVEAAIEALETADDLRAVREALADPEPPIPWEDVLAEYAHELAEHPEK